VPTSARVDRFRIHFECAVLVLALMSLPGLASGCRDDAKGSTAPPKPPEVTISQVVERQVTDYDEFTGRMDSVESVDVRSRVRGYITAIHFTDGQEVKAGQLLFEIDPRPFEAELKNAEGLKAQWIAKRDKAQADVKRYEGLVPSGAASAQDLDKARAELGEAVAAMQSSDAAIDRAKLDLEFSRITAPIAGQVGRALITKGNLVQAGQADDSLLTTIVSLNPIYVFFDVNERSLLRFRDRYRAERLQSGAPDPAVSDLKIPVTLGLATDKGFPHQGVIDFSDNRVDPGTGTITVRATLDNTKRTFKPGLFATLRVPVSGDYKALLVSQTAIATDQGQKYVLAVNEQGIVERRFVRPGALQDDGLQVVTDGLRPGDWIVVNGIQRARPGKPVTPQRAPMPTIQIGAGTSKTTTQPAAASKPS